MAKTADTYAVISVGGKQYRVREGERLLVDRLPYDEGKTFHPDLLLVGGDGDTKLGDGELKGRQVTARVAAHVLGDKVVVGKHRRRTGYRRRKGHRSRLSQIEIQTIGAKAARTSTPKETPAKKTAAPRRKTTTTARKTSRKKTEEKK
jgi:large subunit ribosomal protein L21